MANKKVVISCEGFKARRQEGNGYTQGEIKDILGLQEVGYELEQGSEPVFADSRKTLVLQSGITGATVTANLMELDTTERQEFLGVQVEDGMELYTSDLVPPYLSVSWKLKCNDGTFIHYGLTRGNFSIPNSSAATMENSPEQQDQVEMEGNFMSRDSDKLVFVRVHDQAEGFDEQKFLEKIHGAATTEEIPAG
ncbi:major tail protein [Mammaliicoccus sciuri]|uniref:major tail protein n=1 Tax=Mammaliicoccus sciuri TaxID=1296 RepID=UPI002DB8418D|nr:major tail protein [Mammaliicoccus sciuri]MEB5757400.1 hypothetical protein [Mammaliicoccus sciuri]